MTKAPANLEDELHLLDVKLKQLKLDYEQYFCGSRPREPQQLRSEIQKAIVILSQSPIQNTAMRFKFNGINSRFQAYKRQWDVTLRKIDAGTYERHVFKANLRERQARPGAERERPAGGSDGAKPPQQPGELFSSYRDAAMACGQDVSKLTPEKLERVVAKQRDALRAKLGCEDVSFRVVVEGGKVKLKASAQH